MPEEKAETLSLKEYLREVRSLEARRPRCLKRVFAGSERSGERFEFLFESFWGTEIHEDCKVVLTVAHHFDGEEKRRVRIPMLVLQDALKWLDELFEGGVLNVHPGGD